MSRLSEILPFDFYQGEDPVSIAKELLGKVLKTKIGKEETSGIIVETEAYMAPHDLACHARGNKLTPRTRTMFGPPGRAYVYKCYGIHDLFNVVTGPEGMAHAVLVRSIEPLQNAHIMERRRNISANKTSLVNGPGKLTVALGISIKHDQIDVTKKASPLHIIDYKHIDDKDIIAGPRVGMSPHTKECGYYPWRFRIRDNKWTSKPDKVVYDW